MMSLSDMSSTNRETNGEIISDETECLIKKIEGSVTDKGQPEKVITCSGRLLLLWFVAFVYMMAYQCSSFTFGQYLYVKLQKESFPNITINTTKSFCEENTSSINYQIQIDVQEKAARWTIYFYISGSIMGIAANFVLGSYTDRFGRKFLFLFPSLGTITRTVLATICMELDLSLFYYCIGYFIEGCTGQIFSIFQVAFIYGSDITIPGKQRSFAMVAIELAFGLGATFPNLAIGYVLQQTNSFLIPMYISLGLLVFAFVLIIALPETFPKEVRAKRKYVTFYENLKDATDLYISKTNDGRRWMYIILIAAFVLTSFSVFGRVSVEGLYLLNSPFCFGPDQLGIYNTLKTGLQQVTGIILVAVFLMCTSDEVVAVIGCISFAGAFVLEALARSDLEIYMVSVIGCCGLLTIPMIRSIMSQMTSPQKQGAVFASISAAETTTNLISAVSSNTIYLATVSIYRGFIFIVYAAINVLCAILIIMYMVGSKKEKRKYVQID